ncbi:MAG: hypothetical protein REJ23_16575, partial [Brevundimonas sp.]|nr:hypothetical protein [Brevundimonas sp.]
MSAAEEPMFAELAFAAALTQEQPQFRRVETAPGTFTSVYVSNSLPWRSPPNIVFPDRARDRDVMRGEATIECDVAPTNGRLSACRVLSETPDGAGFGSAAVSGSARSSLDPARWTSPTVAFSIAFN